MGKPGKRPGKPIERPGKTNEQVVAERELHARQNAIKRAENLERLIGAIEPPSALFLLKNPRGLRDFVDARGCRLFRFDKA